MKANTVISEARAKIIWGEPPADVRAFLISNGFPSFDADARIQEFVAERNAEIRRIGLKKIIVGMLIIGGASLMAYYGNAHIKETTSYGRLVIGSIVIGIGGLWWLVNGIIDLIRPDTEHESITELED